MDRNVLAETEAHFVRFCGDLVPQKMREDRIRAAYGEFRTLCAHPAVARIAATKDEVYVGTKILVADDAIHEIGEFLLMITIRDVRWENLTRQVDGSHAPYISINKTVCGLRSLESELRHELKVGRLYRAFPLMINIATTTNGYFASSSVSRWPVVTWTPNHYCKSGPVASISQPEVGRPIPPLPFAGIEPKKKGLWPWKK
jgi:hypothetical protein